MLGTLAQFARQVRRPALAAVAAAAMVLPALSTSSLARGPDGIADVAEQVIDAVVNISTSQKVEARNNADAAVAATIRSSTSCSSDFFNRRGQSDNAEPRTRAAPGQFARFRFRHRCVRHRGHQQPRDRGGRRDHRHPQRRHAPQGRVDRQGSEDRSRAAAGQARQAAQGGEVRRFGKAAARRMGDRDRQPVQPRRHGDRRHRLGAQPRHQFRARTTTTFRPTPPSIAAIRAARCSTSKAR